MATARVARTLRVLVFIIVGVVLWQCRSMLRTGGIDELRACKDRIAELERQLTSGGVRVGEVADGTSSASMNGRRALDTPHAPPNQHESFVTGDGNVLKPIQVRLRGGAIEEVDVNFTLFSAASLERFEAMVPTSLLPKTRVFVVIVSSQSMRSAKQRTLIRETWMRQIQEELEPADIVARFFVGVSSTSGIPVSPGVMNEMQQNNDMVVVSVGDAYGGLIAKVQASLQWVVSSIRADVVAKFDDDCYVSPTALLRELTQLPRERLYWGRMMGGGPIQRNGGRNAEPNMPRGVDWFPPYASGGGGYALSWDLVHAVAFPLVKQLDMVNEDGHLGVMLLPYDIHRETTHRLHPYGLQREGDKCISADDIVAVHYVKDAGEHDCMAAIHRNITAGLDVCESRYCGPINCDFEFPRPRKRYSRKCSAASASASPARWSAIHITRSCEINPDGVERFFVAKRMRDLSCCQQLCEELCNCTAIDYYRITAWCNLYTTHCVTPQKTTEGASSYVLDRNAL